MYSDIKKRCIVRRLVKQASASRLVKLARAAAALQNLRMMEKQADPWELRNPRVGGLYSGNRMNRWIKEKGMSRDQFERRGGKWRFKGGGGPQPPAGGSGGPLALRDSGGQLAPRGGGPLALRGGGGGPIGPVSGGGPIASVPGGRALSSDVNLQQLGGPQSKVIDVKLKPHPRPQAAVQGQIQGSPLKQLPSPKSPLAELEEFIRNYKAKPKASGGGGGMLGRFGRAALGAARRHPIGAALAAAGLGSAALYGGYRWLRGRGGSGSEAVAAAPPAPAPAPEEEVSAPAPAPAPSRADKIRGRLPGGDVVGDGYNLTNPRKYKFRGPAATKDEYRNMMRDAAAASYGKAWSQLTPDEKKTLRDRYYNTQAGAYLDNNNGKNWYVPNFMRDQYGVEEQAMLDDGEVAPFKLKPTDDPYVYPEPEPAPAPQPSGPSQFVQGLRTPEQIRREVQQKSQADRAAWQAEQAPPPEPEPEPETPPPPAQNSSRTMTWYPGRPMVNSRNMRRIQSGVAPRVPVFQPFGSQQVEY